LRKLDGAHQELRIRWQEQQKSKEDETQKKTTEVALLKKKKMEKNEKYDSKFTTKISKS